MSVGGAPVGLLPTGRLPKLAFDTSCPLARVMTIAWPSAGLVAWKPSFWTSRTTYAPLNVLGFGAPWITAGPRLVNEYVPFAAGTVDSSPASSWLLLFWSM